MKIPLFHRKNIVSKIDHSHFIPNSFEFFELHMNLFVYLLLFIKYVIWLLIISLYHGHWLINKKMQIINLIILQNESINAKLMLI